MANKTTKTDLYKIDPENIQVVDNFNARIDFGDIEELAAQIAKDGVLNPIHVRRIKGETDKFALVDGERRYRAIMYNIEHGIPMGNVPAIVVSQNSSNIDLIRTQIQCNEGKNFTEYEYAVAYQKLRDEGLSNIEIAEVVGKKPLHVSYCIAHMKRDQRVQDLMRDGRISGADVRRIYQAHKDESEAIQTILALKNIADKNGDEKLSIKEIKNISADNINTIEDNNTTEDNSGSKKKIQLSDNDFSKTIVAMDTTAIKNGLNKLWSYLDKLTPEQKKSLSIVTIKKNLESGMLIDEALGLKETTLRKAE